MVQTNIGAYIMLNDTLYDNALKAIERYFRDRSVSIAETRAGLQSLQDEIVVMLDAIRVEFRL